MDSNPDRDNPHKIVILNPKGGSGKTTLATNLASFFARRGPPPTLIDCDPQGFSTRWLHKRSVERPKVHGIAAFDHCNRSLEGAGLRGWPGSQQLIIDLPAALADEQLYYQTYDANSILIPVMPSEIDIYSASRFIANLLLVTQFDRSKRNLAVVANRTRQNTKSLRLLMRFLTSLEIPMIAQLRDSQNYVHAAALGIGIPEMPAYLVRKDIEQIDRIVAWLDDWRTRRLDAVALDNFEYATNAAVLTSALPKHQS